MKTYEEEQVERKNLMAKMVETAEAVAKELGEGWSAKRVQWEENGHVHLVNVDGREIGFRVSVYHFDGRLYIEGVYDFGPGEFGIRYPYGMTRPDITVALDREPKVIAREINRRFITQYNEAFESIKKSVKHYTEDRDRKQGISERLAKVSGETRFGKDGFTHYDSGKPSIEVKVYSDIEIKIGNCSEELAEKIIKLVQGQ